MTEVTGNKTYPPCPSYSEDATAACPVPKNERQKQSSEVYQCFGGTTHICAMCNRTNAGCADAFSCSCASNDAEACDPDDCLACGYFNAPCGEPLHFHHDGCPKCSD